LRGGCTLLDRHFAEHDFGEHLTKAESWFMDIEDWRKNIDELDRKLVALLSERARAAVEIGKLKRNTSLPIYEPDRERIVFENVQAVNPGPLPGRDLVRIYERIIDVMRNIQKEEIVPHQKAVKTETELESDVND
jgi:chorismate mutase